MTPAGVIGAAAKQNVVMKSQVTDLPVGARVPAAGGRTTLATPTDGHFVSGFYANELFVAGSGTSITSFSMGFIKTDGTCQFTITNTSPITITSGQFSYSQSGFSLSGNFSSATTVNTTAIIDNYYISSACGSVSGGPLTDTLYLTACNNAGETTCSGACVNIKTDRNHCGSCTTVCTASQVCTNGYCVTGTAQTGQCLVPGQTHLECVNNACKRKVGAGANLGGCTAVGASCGTTACNSTNCSVGCCSGNTCVLWANQNANTCGTGGAACAACGAGKTCSASGVCQTGSSSQADACWGNNGTDGKCLDCNGDGTINVLDFSCFRIRYGMTVQ